MLTIRNKPAKRSKIVKPPDVLRRHSTPTMYDHAPKGTLCIVQEQLLYIQNSEDDNKPNWVLQGPYKEKV